MKVFGKRVNETEIPLLLLFVVSIVFAMIFMFFQKSELLLHSEVFDENTLSLMKYQAGGSKSLFLYVLKERIWVIPLLFLVSSTYLAVVYVYGMVIWYGVGVGSLLALAIMRYGIVGIFLMIGAGLPHYLLYIPVVIIALQLCRERRIPNKKFFLQLLVLEVVVIIGCFLESYVNLMLVEKIIENFMRL